MALLQPICCWRPASAAKCTLVTAALRAAPPSGASTGLDSRARGVGLGNSRSLREWNEEKSSARGIDIAARRGARGKGVVNRGATFCRARGPRKSRRPSPLKTVTASRNSGKEDNKDEAEEDGFGEDALEELFAQLEKDLEAGGLLDMDDVSEEEIVELENELAAALVEIEEQEGLATGSLDVKAESISAEDNDPDSDVKLSSPESSSQVPQDVDEFDDVILNEEEEHEDEQRTISLEPWQLRKLAAAVELGRRKVNIKALSAEVRLDRFAVLAWLRDPPPELLLYSATMDPKEDREELQPDQLTVSSSLNTSPAGQQEDDSMEPEGRKNWHSQKRLRKEHEATFERVFRKTDRPTNAMVQNMVELTHVPRKRVVEWFERRRKEVKPSKKFDGSR